MELVLLTVPDPNAAAFVGAPGRRAGRASGGGGCAGIMEAAKLP
jgi:hypothetical protein